MPGPINLPPVRSWAALVEAFNLTRGAPVTFAADRLSAAGWTSRPHDGKVEPREDGPKWIGKRKRK